MKQLYALILVFFTFNNLSAQISIDPYCSANFAIDSILKGSGIVVSNAASSAQTGSWGKFDITSSFPDLGFNHGLILTTGSAININQNPSIQSSVNSGDTSSTEISSLVQGNPTFDKCALEFNFIPLFDTIEIKYIYASEEYNEYIGSSFVDAFGFFITGQNPQGNNYNNYNFATVELYAAQNNVNVNTINNGIDNTGPCTNCDLYRNGTYGIIYDGLTTTLTAKVAVVRNTSYHLKIVIADVNDRYYDSGIFLKAHSLKSPCDTSFSIDNYITVCSGDSYSINGHTYNYPGTYYDTLQTQLGCDSIIITHFSVQYIQNYFYVASQEGNQVIMSNQTFGSNLKFAWDFGDGYFAYQSYPDTISHLYNQSGYYNICFSAIDTLSMCFNKQCTNTPININAIECDAQFNFSSDGDTAFFTSYSSGNITDYYWIFETGEISHEQNPTIIFPASGYYNATLRVFNSLSGCFSETQQLIYIGSYWNDCRANFSYFPYATNNQVIFSNQSIGANIDYLIWDFGDGTFSNLANPSHFYTESGLFDVCLTVVSSNNNCQNTKCKRVISGNPNQICRSQITSILPSEILNPNEIPVTFKGQIFSSIPNVTYDFNWNMGDSTVYQNQSNFIHNYLNSGLYLVHLNITSSLCSDNIFELVNLYSSNNFNVMFGVLPILDEDKDQGKKPIKFKGVTTGEPSLFNWDFGDGETDTTSMFPTHEFFPNISYNVCLTVTNTKIGESNTYCKNIFILDTTAAVSEIKNDILIKCFPNPSCEFLNIDFQLSLANDVIISLYDIKGIKQKELINQKFNNEENHLKFNLKNFNRGIYFIEIQTNNSIIIKKIIIQ